MSYVGIYEKYIANFQDDDNNFISTKDDYVMHFMGYIIENCDRHVGSLAVDISGLMTAFNQEMNLLEQKYGDKLHEVYHAVKLSNTEIENSLNKEWNKAMDEYQKGSSPYFPSADNYNPYKDSNYVYAFEKGSFLSSIAMRNALNKLPEYKAGNIEDLALNLDAAKEYNDSLTYHLVCTYPSMCKIYNAIANDNTFSALLDDYKERFVNANNHDYDAFENNEHDGVGNDEYDDVGDDAI